MIAEAHFKKGDEWQPIPSAIKARTPILQQLIDASQLPYYQDGLDLFKVFRVYYDSVLSEVDVEADDALATFWTTLGSHTGSEHILNQPLTKDSLADVLAQYSFLVTAHHEHVGSIAEYLETPKHCGFRIRKDATAVDAQSFFIGNALMAMTSIKTPDLQDPFRAYFKPGIEAQTWNRLQKGLLEVERRVDARNKTRSFKFDACNPRILQCAVSV